MRIEDHLQKLRSIEGTLNKLDNEADYEAIVELCVLISAHYANAALHKLRITPADRDIKHNRLAGEIGRRKVEELLGIRAAIDALEQLRPRHVYGRGSDGGVANRALEMVERVRKTCMQVLG
ncbi:MAG: hypothetical protein QMD95_04000 [Candidatus Hodarchaeaceae archaeon]|nr:hypothetical protein [Candidatus Hodarchaeaceae archaeon]